MSLHPITIDGKSGTVVYLDREWHPVEPEHATMAKVIFDNGDTAFFTTGEQETVDKFDPAQPRDEEGRWVDTESIKTERPMVLAKGAQSIISHYAAGRMPLDADKVATLEKVIQSGKTLPPLIMSPEGILRDGHHRLQAYRNRGVKVVRVVDEAQKFDPHQLRDEKGRWATGGKAGALATDLGNTFLHGTAQGFLEDILKNGIRGSEGGKIHPKDRRNRTLALPGHVYMTTDLAEAKEYAESAGLSDEFFTKHKETVLNPVYAKGYPRVPEYQPSYDAGTEIGGGLPCVITIELPPSVVKKLRKDRRSDILTPSPYAEGGGKRVLSDFARSYKGDIKPEWIKSITYQTRDMATGKEEWHTIDAKDYKKPGPQTPPYLPQPPGWEVTPEWQEYLNEREKKVAADGTVVYLALKIPLQSVAGIGGITQKFDEAKHPRGKDGRFKEATEPRIFNRLSDVEQYESWGREKRWQWRKETPKSGFLLTGEPIPREQLPPVLYHVTTNAPAVESSGVLLGLQEGGGLGGGQAEGVSFTSSKEDADVILRELKRSVLIARGEVDIDVFERWAREDEQTAGLPEGTLNHAVEFSHSSWDVDAPNMGKTHYWDKDAPEGERYKEGPPASPEEKERVRRSLLKDALNAYLIARDTVSREQNAPSIKNPILFGRQEHLAKLDPEGIQILEVESAQIPTEALVTTGSDTFLHEVRAYSDVPYRRRKVAYDPNQARGSEGTPEGGQFVETGRSGVPTSDPVLAVQAKAGIAAVEKLLPEAMKTANFTDVMGDWEDLPEQTRERAYKYYVDKTYDEIDIQAIDADLTVDVRWDLREGATPETAKRVAEKTKVWVEGRIGDKALDTYAKDKSVSGSKPLDFKTLSVPDPTKLTDAGYPVLDLNALRHTDGTELTPWEKSHVRGIWADEHKKVIEDEVQIVQDSDEYLAKREVMVRAEVLKRWEKMTGLQKSTILPEMISLGQFKDVDNPYGTTGAREPTQWMTGVETGTHEEADYARTHALAQKLTELRTDELRKERGLFQQGEKPEYTIVERPEAIWHAAPVVAKAKDGHVVAMGKNKLDVEIEAEQWANEVAGRNSIPTQELIQGVWQQWIRKSSEGLSLSLQLAAARELGGHHRLTPDELQEAEDAARVYGGIETLQAYVRAQWEVTQMVMKKAGQEKVSVYRGLMLEGKKVDETPNVLVEPSGVPVSKPTNVKVLVDTTVGGQEIKNKQKWPVRETVTFDFEGEHFTVLKNREPSPQSWDEVRPEVKEQMAKQWEKQVKEVVAEHPNEPGYTYEKGANILERMSEAGKMQMLQDWRRMGELEPEPFESTESAVNRILADTVKKRRDIYTKLPEITLQRSGAQSTTGTADVANDWGGVGNLPENPERVVLRIEAPPTSVLSLPVYGDNNQEEHESVLLGTKDKWLWDAWRDVAPHFEDQGIGGTVHARKAEMKPLVIDLQAEDRGKPHWMSSVDWSKVQKFDEAKHPRDTKGQFAPFYHGTSNEIAEKILQEGLLPLSDMDRSSPVGKAFAATSEKVALSYAAMASDDSVDTITVIVFKPEASQFFKPAGKEMKGKPVPGSWGDARRTEMSSTETVPPEMIQEIRQYKLADVIEAIGPQGGKQYADWESPLEDLDPVSVVKKAERIYVAILTNSGTVVKWDEQKHPRDKDGQFTEGVGHGEKAAQPDAGAGGGGGVAVPSPAPKAKGGGRPEAVPEVQAVADAYNAQHGMPPVQHDYAKLDEARAGTIADAYDALPLDDSGNPEVRAAYEALATEIRAQFDHIVASGVTFTPWTKEGQPYQNSTEMVDDIRKNKHMFFYTGGDPNPFMAARDPETGLTTNDMFRAVHDYFGHAAGGYGFGPRGEENAWMSHSQMLTPLARRALTTETRGQNSWVNFGRQNYDAEGNHKNIPPQDRPFATQKTALMPEQWALLPGETTLKFDESQVVRSKEKGHEGEFSQKKGMTYAPDSQFLEPVKDYIESELVVQHLNFHGGYDEHDVPLDEMKARVTATGRAMLERAVPTIRVPDFLAVKILEDGRFKSQHESGRSRGTLDPEYRAKAEKVMFGTDPEGDLADRPIYGVFIEDFAKVVDSRASQYGEVVFVLKDSVLDRTTVSFGDSLSEGYHSGLVAPRPYREFDWVGVGTSLGLTNDTSVDSLYSYAEAQFHGGVTLDDVKEVMVPLPIYTYWETSGTLAKFKARGVAVRVIGPTTHKARV